MEFEVKYGYVRKVNIATHELLGHYSYPELLLYPRIRTKLQAEMEDNNNIHLYCSCGKHNNRPVLINKDGSLYFPAEYGHDSSCVSYISALLEFVNHPLIRLFLVSKPTLPVGFKWSERSHTTYCMITNPKLGLIESNSKTIPLEDFVKLVNLKVFYKIATEISRGERPCYPSSEEMLLEIRFELGKYTFLDPSGALYPISERTLFNSHASINSVCFLYAKILSVDRSYKSKVYFTAQHLNGISSFSISHEKWDRLEAKINQNLPLYVCGFVRTVENTAFTKGQRDSVTHVYQSGSSKKIINHLLTSFCLFHTTKNGMLCCSEQQYSTADDLCKSNELCYLPFFPDIPGINMFSDIASSL